MKMRECWCEDMMNSSLAVFISGGVSFGVIAALCSGIFYLVITGLKYSSFVSSIIEHLKENLEQLNLEPQGSYVSRLKEILDLPSIEYPVPGPTFSSCKALSPVSAPTRKSCNRCFKFTELRRKCFKCRMKVCRACSCKGFCSSCRSPRNENRKSGDWFYQRLQKEFNLKVAAIANNSSLDGEVREFMERLVETLVGGSLDDVSLTPLSSHPQYLSLCERHQEILSLTLARLSFGLHMAIANKPLPELESPSTVTSELKSLVQKLTDETLALPQFLDDDPVSKTHVNTINLEGQTYEDILAKAIINKVVEKCQRGVHSPNENKSNGIMTISPNFLRKRNVLMSSDGSEMNGSGNFSWSADSTQSDPISLKVEEHIEEVTTHYSSDDEEKSNFDQFLSSLKFLKGQRAPCPELGCDIIDGTVSSSDDDWSENDSTDCLDVINPVDSWEENWLFQRRRLAKTNSCHQPVPVPMLVPNPALEYRALIGDIDADETSDLSECSDSVLEQLIDEPGYNSMTSSTNPNSCKDENDDFTNEYITLEQTVNITLNPKSSDSEAEDRKVERKIEPMQSSSLKCNGSLKNESLFSRSCKTSEYSLSPSLRSSSDSDDEDSPSSGDIVQAKNENVFLSHQESEDESLETETQQRDREYTVATIAQTHAVPEPKFDSPTESELFSEHIDDNSDDTECGPRPGTIAEREHKKWEKAVPLENNPYSKQNIDKRLKSNFILSKRANCDTTVDFSTEQTVHIGGNLPDMKRYSRDYYINTDEDQNERTSHSEPRSHSTETRISQETKACEGTQQVSVRVEVDVWPSEKVIKQQATTIIEESPQNSPIIQTTVNMNKVNGNISLEKEFEPLEKPGVRISSWHDNEKKSDEFDECHSLPSVKELAKHFSTGEDCSTNHTILKPSPILPAIPKMFEMKHNYPSKQIHSLTARSISREFREGLRCSHNVMRNNVLLPTKPLEINKEDSGHVSDDSGTASPTPLNMPKLHDNIAFWEQMTLNS